MEYNTMEKQLISPQVAVILKRDHEDIGVECDKLWSNYYTGNPPKKWKLISFRESALSSYEYKCPTQFKLREYLSVFHEILSVKEGRLKIIRVASGWIYICHGMEITESGYHKWVEKSSVFVPYNNEFQ